MWTKCGIVASSLSMLSVSAMLSVAGGMMLDTAHGDSDVLPVLETKLRLLDALILDSDTARRVEKSDDQFAHRLLDVARSTRQQADTLLKNGRSAEAEVALNEGLRAISDASKLVANPQRVLSSAKPRYHNLYQRVVSFRSALDRIIATGGGSVSSDFDLQQVGNLMRDAEKKAKQEAYLEATELLAQLSHLLETELSHVLHAKTLTHELNFDSLDDEYAYEKQRHGGYKMLVEQILSQGALTKPAFNILDAARARSAKLEQEAERLLISQQVAKAIAKMEQANNILANSLYVNGAISK